MHEVLFFFAIYLSSVFGLLTVGIILGCFASNLFSGIILPIYL